MICGSVLMREAQIQSASERSKSNQPNPGASRAVFRNNTFWDPGSTITIGFSKSFTIDAYASPSSVLFFLWKLYSESNMIPKSFEHPIVIPKQENKKQEDIAAYLINNNTLKNSGLLNAYLSDLDRECLGVENACAFIQKQIMVQFAPFLGLEFKFEVLPKDWLEGSSNAKRRYFECDIRIDLDPNMHRTSSMYGYSAYGKESRYLFKNSDSMKVSSPIGMIFCHEFGHALGLDHSFLHSNFRLDLEQFVWFRCQAVFEKIKQISLFGNPLDSSLHSEYKNFIDRYGSELQITPSQRDAFLNDPVTMSSVTFDIDSVMNYFIPGSVYNKDGQLVNFFTIDGKPVDLKMSPTPSLLDYKDLNLLYPLSSIQSPPTPVFFRNAILQTIGNRTQSNFWISVLPFVVAIIILFQKFPGGFGWRGVGISVAFFAGLTGIEAGLVYSEMYLADSEKPNYFSKQEFNSIISFIRGLKAFLIYASSWGVVKKWADNQLRKGKTPNRLNPPNRPNPSNPPNRLNPPNRPNPSNPPNRLNPPKDLKDQRRLRSY